MTNHETLVECFKSLSRGQRRILLAHADKGTPILCGDEARLFADGAGSGCPAMLSTKSVVPDFEIDNVDDMPATKEAFSKFQTVASSLGRDYYSILENSSEDDVRRAVRQAAREAGV